MSCEKRGKEISTLTSDRMWQDHGTLINVQDNPGHGKSQQTQHGEIPEAEETQSLQGWVQLRFLSS